MLYGEGPLLVLAGAGSGKTSTMAYRIAHLIAERDIAGTQVLGLSFTRKAAEELRERVRKLVSQVAGFGATRGLTITTFHSLAVRILRVYADRIGFQRDFTILDQSDQTDIIRQILRHLKIDDRKFDPDIILFEIGQAKNRFLTPDQAHDFFLESGRMADDYAVISANTYEKYQDQLKVLNAMDFDDLLFHAVNLLEKHTDVRAEMNDRFRYILVDEYQDTNPAQSRLLHALTHVRQNICVVGDDDQSIYAWRGADPTHILNFTRHYPGAHTVTLDQNYRSTSTILDAANHVISKNKVRHPKTLWSERGTGEPITQVICEGDRAEADVVGDEILSLSRKPVEGRFEQVRPWKDFAVLYRSNPQSRLFEEALRMRQIPYKIVGALSFLDRKEIKDTLSYWRLIVNQHDDASCRRVINWPSRGIGKTSIEAISTHALQAGVSFFDALAEAPRLTQAKGAASAIAFRNTILELRAELEKTAAEPAALAAWAKKSLERFGVKKALEEENDDPIAAQRKWENVDELANAIGQVNIQEFLGSDSFDPPPPSPQEKMTLAEIAASLEYGDTWGDEFVSAPAPIAESEMTSVLDQNLLPGAYRADSTSEVRFVTEETGSVDQPEESTNETTEENATPAVTIVREYLARMTLNTLDDKKDDQPKDEVTLLTLHGSKGLEFPVVFMVGLEEGLLPHRRTIEEGIDFSEERRLAYVGITRAKDHLYITRCKDRIRYGKKVPRNPSRFLEEIPAELMLTRNESTTPDLSSPQAQEQHEVKVKDFLAAIRAQIGGQQK